jgi:hypothetical protein
MYAAGFVEGWFVVLSSRGDKDTTNWGIILDKLRLHLQQKNPI